MPGSAKSKGSRNHGLQEFDSPLKKPSAYGSRPNVTASASTQATRQTTGGSPLPAAVRAAERRQLRENEAKELIAKTKAQTKATV